MKKFLMLSVACVALAPAAFAEEGTKEGVDMPYRKGVMEGEKHKEMGKAFFEKMDANKDGKISKEEFMAAHEGKFAKADTNGDGAISQDEFKARGDAMREEHKKRMEERRERREDRREEREEHQGDRADEPETTE